MEKFLTAIIICKPNDPLSNNPALKYRRIINKGPQINKFMEFAKGFPTAQYVNFYGRYSRNYMARIYFDRQTWATISKQKRKSLNIFYE